MDSQPAFAGKESQDAPVKSQPVTEPTNIELMAEIQQLTKTLNTLLRNQEMTQITLGEIQDYIKKKVEKDLQRDLQEPILNESVNPSFDKGKTKVAPSATKRKTLVNNMINELDNIIMELSDSEEELPSKKPTRSSEVGNSSANMIIGKPVLPLEWTNQTISTAKKSKSSKDSCVTENKSKSHTIPKSLPSISKRLFHGLSPSNLDADTNSAVEGSLSQNTLITPTTKVGKNFGFHSTRSTPNHSGGLPKGIKWKFKATKDMLPTPQELRAYAYLFHPEQPNGEILVMSRKVVATRGDFQSYIPGMLITEDVVTLTCERLSLVQKQDDKQRAWFFPPSLAVDIFKGDTLRDLLDKYGKRWMIPYPNLKYVFVPIKAAPVHWYLMVISIPHKAVFHFDSFLPEEEVLSRHQTISKLCEVLTLMVYDIPNLRTCLGDVTDFSTLPIKDAIGIPPCGNSLNAGVWLLEWLEMQETFNPRMNQMLADNKVRMRAALKNLLGPHNDITSTIENRATSFWEKLHAEVNKE